MTAPLRVLVVSYAFPPVGGAGVQRVLKLVKYLPLHGVVPAVLTVQNPSAPLRDESLANELPPDLEILRAATLEPAYDKKRLVWDAAAAQESNFRTRVRKSFARVARGLIPVDPQILWLPGSAFALAKRLASPAADEVVLISGPPFSPFLLSVLARARPRTAVVLDYRDEWTTTRGTYEMGAGDIGSDRLERTILSLAHHVVTATDEFRDELLRRFPEVPPTSVTAIPNGYDPDDFPRPLPAPRSDKFVLTYVGTVFRLTSARAFLAAVRLLHEREPGLASLLDVRFVGRIVETEAAHFGGMEALGVTRRGYVPHGEALSLLAESHAVLCLLGETEGTERILPAKIFEIMHLERPCLVLSPEGALSRLVRRYGIGEVVAPGDVPAIAEALARRLRAFQLGTLATSEGLATLPSGGVERFDRKQIAADFARVLRSAATTAQAGWKRDVRSTAVAETGRSP